MEQKAKKTGRLKRSFTRFLGPERTRKLLCKSIIRGYRVPPLSLPINPGTVKSLLCIMPRTPVDTIHQIGTVLSLIALFKSAHTTLLCNSAVSSFVKNLQNVDIIEYDDEDSILFSHRFRELANEFNAQFDVCVMLEKAPDLPLLYLAGQTAAPVRAGYEIEGGYPFLNYRIKPSGNHVYAGDWNSAISTLFGTKPVRKIRWSVSKDTLEEVKTILKELSVPLTPPLIGVDLIYFVHTYGRSWSEALVKSMKASLHANLFIYSEMDPQPIDVPWYHQFGWPIVSDLSVPRIAALITMTNMMITGNTVLFAMTGLLEAPMIGLFEEKELNWNCPKMNHITGIAYHGEPDLNTIESIVKVVKTRVKA